MTEGKIKEAEQQTANALAIEEEEWHDLLPVEKKLIGYSLGLGIALLVVFIGVFEIL
ncbi:hypothetical protein DCCM_4401 [Desulfocucumis palustris]|uniref:Uncharacterized protein n=1 Tax=Desulfocucumis palustris TaxID=1898651 RepID=A0A2L2XGA5_9FIRM|nr:hypothetical protein [Desulfocucumis palustris]GBF35278.1 hypothetical protein DCCM_4401 [Desulfocucumis palustris]